MKHFPNRIIICSSLLLAASSLSAQQTGANNSNTFVKITRDKYTISYPTSWSVDTSGTLGLSMIIRSPKSDSLDNFAENVNIFTQDLKGQQYSLSKMGQESEAQLKNMVTDIEVLESRFDSTATPQCYILKYKGRQGKFSLTTTQHYYLKDEVGYAVTLTLQAGKEKDYEAIGEKIFASFRAL